MSQAGPTKGSFGTGGKPRNIDCRLANNDKVNKKAPIMRHLSSLATDTASLSGDRKAS